MAVAVDSRVELLIIVLTVPSLERWRSVRLLVLEGVLRPVVGSYFSWRGWLL